MEWSEVGGVGGSAELRFDTRGSLGDHEKRHVFADTGDGRIQSKSITFRFKNLITILRYRRKTPDVLQDH